MKPMLSITGKNLLVALLFAGASTLAYSHNQPQVNWSVSIGSPSQPIYYSPQPVYVQTQPIYVQSAPVVQYRTSYYRTYTQPYYVENIEYKRHEHRHWKHHHDHHHEH